MKLVSTTVNGMRFWYQKDDRYVGQRVALDKYETYETKLILKQVNEESVVVDVGANIGYYTLLLAQKCKKVYAIEPEKTNFEILIKNVRENNLENVILLNIAAGSKKEKKQLVIDDKNFGNHRLSGGQNGLVNVERLDDILKNEQIIDLIKIDTQGWEPEVIDGAIKTIERDIPTMFLEYWPEGMNESKLDGARMIQKMRQLYPTIWQISDALDIYYQADRNIKVDNKGYVDLWMKKNLNPIDYIYQFKDLRIKELIKAIINYGKHKKN